MRFFSWISKISFQSMELSSDTLQVKNTGGLLQLLLT